jgi:hypothetical protein
MSASTGEYNRPFFGENFQKTMALPQGKERNEGIADFIKAFRLIFKIGRQDKQKSVLDEMREIDGSDPANKLKADFTDFVRMLPLEIIELFPQELRAFLIK